MQSVGRGLRKLAGKLFVMIHDFVDDFRVESTFKKHENYIWQHGRERHNYYKNYYEDAVDSSIEIIKVDLNKSKPKQLF
jgi:methionine salvage enolase-phosphatase E1